MIANETKTIATMEELLAEASVILAKCDQREAIIENLTEGLKKVPSVLLGTRYFELTLDALKEAYAKIAFWYEDWQPGDVLVLENGEKWLIAEEFPMGRSVYRFVDLRKGLIKAEFEYRSLTMMKKQAKFLSGFWANKPVSLEKRQEQI